MTNSTKQTTSVSISQSPVENKPENESSNQQQQQQLPHGSLLPLRRNSNTRHKIVNLHAEDVIVEENETDDLSSRNKHNKLKPLNPNPSKSTKNNSNGDKLKKSIKSEQPPVLSPLSFANSPNSTENQATRTDKPRKSKKKQQQQPRNDEEDYYDSDILNHASEYNPMTDLYKTSPSLVDIKQKYKMYLDWLNGNNTAAKQAQSSNFEDDFKTHHQLNWYNYEKSLSRNRLITQTTSSFGYAKNPPVLSSKFVNRASTNMSSINQLPNPYNVRLQRPLNEKKLDKSYFNSLSDSTNGVNSASINSFSPSEDVYGNSMTNKKSQAKLPTSINQITILSKGVKFDHVAQSLTNRGLSLKQVDQNDLYYPQSSNGLSINNLLSQLNNSGSSSSNNSTPLLGLSHPIKPILKSSQNDYHMRRESVISVGSNPSSDKSVDSGNLHQQQQQHQHSQNVRVNANLSTFKLPPITNVRCSDDFYAVLNEMQRERLV
jgi:hypothetical protein